MTDILIPLGSGSRYNNIELMYCLRGIEKHLSGVGRIIIVGEKPWFLNYEKVIHIECEDSTDNKERAHNIYRKIMAGIENVPDLSNDFLFMNDDHFLLSDFDAVKFPYLHRGKIETHRIGNEAQRIQMENTVAVLSSNMTLCDFDVHCPIVYNKEKFEEIFYTLQWPEYGYAIKTVYCNHNSIISKICEDLKFSEPLMKQSIYKVLEGREWFSIGDKCLKSGGMQEVLQELYPNKSKYEI